MPTFNLIRHNLNNVTSEGGDRGALNPTIIPKNGVVIAIDSNLNSWVEFDGIIGVQQNTKVAPGDIRGGASDPCFPHLHARAHGLETCETKASLDLDLGAANHVPFNQTDK